MTRFIRRAVVSLMLLWFLGTGLSALAQRHRDPLNDKEVDELREAAQEPDKRMKLYIGFARARMEAVQQMRGDPKLAGENDSEMRARLEDLATLVDEIDDNLDDFNDKSQDLRKPLKAVIEMDSDFSSKLAELKQASTPEQLRNYGIELEDVTDSVADSADSARSMLADQIAKRGNAKEEKKKEKEDKKRDKNSDDD